MEKKVIKRRLSYDPGTGGYSVVEYYRDGSHSEERPASPSETREYQQTFHRNGVIARQCEGVGWDDSPGRFEESD